MKIANEEVHLLLHQLWTKAVGTKDYDKKQWGRLERFLSEEGYLRVDRIGTKTSPMNTTMSDDPSTTMKAAQDKVRRAKKKEEER